MDHAVSKRSRAAAFRCSCKRGDRSRAPLGRAAAMLEARKDRQRMALHAFDMEMPNATRRTSSPCPWNRRIRERESAGGMGAPLNADRVAKRDRSVANEMHRQESGACILLVSAR